MNKLIVALSITIASISLVGCAGTVTTTTPATPIDEKTPVLVEAKKELENTYHSNALMKSCDFIIRGSVNERFPTKEAALNAAVEKGLKQAMVDETCSGTKAGRVGMSDLRASNMAFRSSVKLTLGQE